MRSHWMAVLALLSWSTAALADAIADCNGATYAQRIQGCTLLINEGKLSTRNMARAYYKRAGAYFERADYDAAIADYTKAIELDPGFESNYSGRAEAHDRKGNYDAAIADYTKIMEIEPKSAWPYDMRGEEFKKKRDYNAAIADYTRALEVDPQIRVESSRADAYLQKGVDHAIGDYTTAIQRECRRLDCLYRPCHRLP